MSELILGDCLAEMAKLPDASADAVVTDPPYGLEFMGKEWDRPWRKSGEVSNGGLTTGPDWNGRKRPRQGSAYARSFHQRCRTCGKQDFSGSPCKCENPDWETIANAPTQMRAIQSWHEAWAREAFRVAKPGAYLLAFGGTRTYHRLASAIEDAGWEIRDCLVYAYASGFPKSASVAKASTAQSWAALLQGALHSSETPGDSPAGYQSGCRLCGQPLRSVSVVVLDAGPLEAGAQGCNHPDGPSVEIRLGNGRTYKACPSCLSCRLATPDCAHLASSPPAPLDARASSSLSRHRPPVGAPLSQPDQTLFGGTPDRSSDVSPSATMPRESDKAQRTPHRGQSEAYTHSTLGCPSCHERYARQAQERAGFGTALKPAWEPIVMARKPLRGTVAQNVQRWGTGAINVDATRIPSTEPYAVQASSDFAGDGGWGDAPRESHPAGRWPANVILTATDDGRAIFDGGVEGVVGGGETTPLPADGFYEGPWSERAMFRLGSGATTYHDSGSYSRFFLIPKAARSDREPLLRGQLEERIKASYSGGISGTSPRDDNFRSKEPRANSHPTVKPLDLMRHLVRLVTPIGGTVLDPFLGSGTTAIACEMEGFAWIGIEKEAEYLEICKARLNGVQRGLGLDVPA